MCKNRTQTSRMGCRFSVTELLRQWPLGQYFSYRRLWIKFRSLWFHQGWPTSISSVGPSQRKRSMRIRSFVEVNLEVLDFYRLSCRILDFRSKFLYHLLYYYIWHCNLPSLWYNETVTVVVPCWYRRRILPSLDLVCYSGACAFDLNDNGHSKPTPWLMYFPSQSFSPSSNSCRRRL